MPTKEFRIICEKHHVLLFFDGCKFPPPSATYCPVRTVHAPAPSCPSNLTSCCSPTAAWAIVRAVPSPCPHRSISLLPLSFHPWSSPEWNTAFPQPIKNPARLQEQAQVLPLPWKILCRLQTCLKTFCELLQFSVSDTYNTTLNYMFKAGTILLRGNVRAHLNKYSSEGFHVTQSQGN